MPARVYRRKSKRAYDLTPTDIKLKGHTFRVSDISSEGLGVFLEEGGPKFFIGERLEKISIPLKKESVAIDGVVTHISVTTAGTVCGIRFLYTGEEFDAILQFKKERGKAPE